VTYTKFLPNGATLTTEINTASPATIRAGLAEVERVAGILYSAPPPVSQVDAVVGEQAVAILERLRDLLGVESMGDVEEKVERLYAAVVVNGGGIVREGE